LLSEVARHTRQDGFIATVNVELDAQFPAARVVEVVDVLDEIAVDVAHIGPSRVALELEEQR